MKFGSKLFLTVFLCTASAMTYASEKISIMVAGIETVSYTHLTLPTIYSV